MPGISAGEMGGRPELRFRLGLAGQQRSVVQRIELLAAHLDRVLQAVEGRLHDAVVGRVGGTELDEAAAQLGGAHQGDGQGQVPVELELGPRLQACRRARMAGNEYQLAGGGSVEFDWQIIGRDGGSAVLIGPQYREIERPAGKLEIVRIAAERRDVALRGEHQSYVVVAFVLVEEVLASLVQSHDLAPELAGFRLRARLLASLFEGGNPASSG